MAEVVISSFLQVIFEKLSSLVLTKLELGGDFRKEFEKLEGTLPVIQAVIEEAEERQSKDKKVRIWLKKLREAAYDTDDLLDKLTTKVLRKDKKVWMSFLRLKPFISYFKLYDEVKGIREGLDDIAREISNFQFREVVVYRRSETGERRETGPFVDASEVYGREADVDKIVETLLSLSNTRSSMNVPIIPITGVGGIGKTTLAQLVYNDQRVTRYFDLKIWVSVYENFNVRFLIRKILASVIDDAPASPQIGVLQSQLQEMLCGKRYLLVLDDVWNDNQEEWDKLRNPLRVGADGSRILVTTRSHRVASIMGSTSPYNLEALTEEDCWILFKERAFADGEDRDFKNLLPIGREIVKKCRGVPLAAKILGSLLRFKREEWEWAYVQESELWNLDKGENGILSVLRLSYNHLPSHLRRCFAYCSVFPKNFEITKEKLIHQWIAEGLIESLDDSWRRKTMEDTGSEYFNDLLWMSFFQRASKWDDSGPETFKLHDLIHDLAKSVAGNEFQILGSDVRSGDLIPTSSSLCGSLVQTRHATVVSNYRSPTIPDALYGARKLRTLNLLLPLNDDRKALSCILTGFKHLRVLNLGGCGVKRLPKSIGGLIYLRYLDLSNNFIETLPETVCDLFHLQTLDLTFCYDLVELPRGMQKLKSLRHLKIKFCEKLIQMPAFIGELAMLQTLPFFVVGRTFPESLFQLMQLADLRGELEIRHLENVVRDEYALHAGLFYKKLSRLVLSWGNDHNERKRGKPLSMQTIRCHPSVIVEDLIEDLCPNPVLTSLALKEYPGSRYPKWMNSDTLKNLKELALINCRKCDHLPDLGQLPFLKILHMQGMDSLEDFGSLFYGSKCNGRPFPSLKQLVLSNCPGLKVWESSDSREAFTCLNKVIITRCPNLMSMPCFPSLRYLELRYCNAFILKSAAKMKSLYALVIDNFPELFFIPKALLENNSRLVTLTISACPKLSSLPASLENLRALKLLKIAWCELLDTFPKGMTNLTSLETLEIIECPSLVSLPEENMERLSSLQSLSIENCHSLTCLPAGMQHLTALQHLTIMYCSNLASLPDSLPHLSSLQSLNILSCPELVSLPQGTTEDIKTLRNLQIQDCPNFMELPQWIANLDSLRSIAISGCQGIRSLPQGLQHLTAIQHLSIRDCPELESRCRKWHGEDWHKISHIPYVYIGSSVLQKRDDALT